MLTVFISFFNNQISYGQCTPATNSYASQTISSNQVINTNMHLAGRLLIGLEGNRINELNNYLLQNMIYVIKKVDFQNNITYSKVVKK